jgi:hypothetical protein
MAVTGRGWMLSFIACLLVVAGPARCAAQDTSAALPEAPVPQQPSPLALTPVRSCELRNAGATMAATAAVRADTVVEADGHPVTDAPRIVGVTLCVPHMPVLVDWYARFLNGPQVKALTPLEKAHLAARNLVDPFNLLTIAGIGAISVAANSHSADGPGFRGYGNYIGVSFTQDMVGEFFGTFLIPSIVHQDPHYHRMPDATIKRRVVHCLTQIVWTEGDNGRGMVNYANLVGFAADESINNLYVPGQQTTFSATATRYGFDLATAPIQTFITEFVPDIASRLHVRIVLVQSIINQVARTEPTASP